MNIFSFSLLGFGFCSLFAGLLVWQKRQDPVGRLYFLFSLTNSLWSIFFGLFLTDGNTYKNALLYARIADSIACFIPVTWLHLCLHLSKRKFNQLHLRLVYIFACILFLFSFSSLFIANVEPVLQFDFFTKPGPLFHVFAIFFFTSVPLGFLVLIQTIRTANRTEKVQLLGLMAAIAPAFLGGSLTFLPTYGIEMPQYGLFLMPFYPPIVGYFIMRRGLFNAEDFADAAHRDKLAAIGTISASMQHEIKGPVNVIHMLADKQSRKLKSPKTTEANDMQEALNKIMLQTKRVNEIIARFSSFTKKKPQEHTTSQTTSVAEVIENVLSLAGHQLFYRGVSLEKEIAKNLPQVAADRGSLEEILFNLIVNACQAFGEKREGTIWLKVMEAGKKIIVTITDNGPGMHKEQVQNIFKPFHTTKEDGTGLGLYITKQLVTKNNGAIEVHSKPGGGTTFTLSFARAEIA